ncbi:MAG: DUF502 domain-containing protein [Deltaproteobacteria bacterium]|nr:DUF502 domain-containing protein [Deltaproteobacteria bacterium]
MIRHLSRCFFAGLLALLPIGGLIFVAIELEKLFRTPLLETAFYFPGLGIVAAIAAIYLLGLFVSTVAGRFFGRLVDALLQRIPGIATFYQTLRQILGYGTGKDALFREAVYVCGEAGLLELGLLTGETIVDGAKRFLVFIPGSPNPTSGRLIIAPPDRCVLAGLSVDAAFKGLLTTGKALSHESTR